MKETFKFFNDEWNEPTTDNDNRGDNYDTDFEDGVDLYIPKSTPITSIED